MNIFTIFNKNRENLNLIKFKKQNLNVNKNSILKYFNVNKIQIIKFQLSI